MYLLTQTLIGAWQYAHDCRPECAESAWDDFLATLRKEPKEQAEAMRNGIEFENAVYAEADEKPYLPIEAWQKGVKVVSDTIKGGVFQVKASRPLNIGGELFLVYGVLDALRCGEIFDVKFSNKSFGSAELAGKYLESPQHPAYFYIVPEAYRFTYLVSDGEDLYTEVYTPEETRPFPEIAEEFIADLKQSGLWETYTEKWRARE